MMSGILRRRALWPILLISGALLVPSGGTIAHAPPDHEVRLPGMVERRAAVGTTSRVPKRGETVLAYRLSWKPRGDQVFARRLSGALETILGEPALVAILGRPGLQQSLRGEGSGAWIRVGDWPVLVSHEPEFNELRLIHEERDANLHAESDIGIDGAREAAELYLSLLGERGVVDPRLFADAVLQVGYKVVGEGPIARRRIDPGRIVEYRMTFRPRLDGFELINAGVRLGILASGELAAIRAGGVTPSGEWRGGALVSDVEGAERAVAIGVDELRTRFLEETAKQAARVDIAWDRVAYVMPEGVAEAVVEPMWIVSYTQQRIIDGVPVASRRKTLAYSLTDPLAGPIDLTAPAARHEGVEPSRRQ